jgi:hypothetical protein
MFSSSYFSDYLALPAELLIIEKHQGSDLIDIRRYFVNKIENPVALCVDSGIETLAD